MTEHDSDLLQMKKLFQISEKRLLEFLEYVPIKAKNLDIESPMIYHMMMSSGPQIEPMMTKVIEIIEPQKIAGDFDECYKILNKNEVLKLQKVMADDNTILNPFTDSNPTWWQAYNSHAKHHLPDGMEKATLKNLLNLHASLFILHSLANLKRFSWPEQNKDNGVFLTKDSWIDLEDDLKNNKPRTCWDISKSKGTSSFEHLLKDYREIMHEVTKMDSAVFEYVTVVKPSLIANVVGT